MGDKDKSRKIGDSVKEMAHYAEEQRLGHGRIEFDELGNAIWVPADASASDDVMRRLLDDGFVLVSVRGSHHKYRHADGRVVILTHPRKDIPAGTARSIYRQAGWSTHA